MTDEQNRTQEVAGASGQAQGPGRRARRRLRRLRSMETERSEQGAKLGFREDQPVADALSDDDKGEEEQYRMSDAALSIRLRQSRRDRGTR